MRRSQATHKIAIHRSLTEEILMGGVPRTMALINGTLGAALGIGGGSYYVIPVFIVIHAILAYIHKDDPLFLICLRRFFYLNYFRRYYET